MTEMSEIVLYLVIFLIGGICGFMLCRMTFGKKQAAAQQQELEDSKAELEHYKSQVNEHFTNSAELMEQVASSYQALYSHMAGQSQTLLGDAEMLPFAQLQTLAEKEQQVTEEKEEVLQADSEQVSEQTVPKRAEPEAKRSAEKADTDQQAAKSSAEKTDTAEQTAESSAEKIDTAEQAAESSAEKTDAAEQATENSAEKTEPNEEAPSKTTQK